MIKISKTIFICFLLLNMAQAQNATPAFREEINAFKQQDSISFAPKQVILFVGSSSFRMWKNVQQDFSGYTIINRGFGGSALPDLIRYADDIIFPYEPKQIVIYCGENDLAASDTVTAELVVKRFKMLFLLIRKNMPAVPILFVSIKPSPSRAGLWPKMEAANKGIKKFLKRKSNTAYADVYHHMFTKDGLLKEGLFIDDNLHMNAKGYAIWQKIIEPYLLK